MRQLFVRGTLGNQLTVMRGPLPVYIRDPVARLRLVRRAMDGLKESKQAVGAATLAQVNNLAPQPFRLLLCEDRGALDGHTACQ